MDPGEELVAHALLVEGVDDVHVGHVVLLHPRLQAPHDLRVDQEQELAHHEPLPASQLVFDQLDLLRVGEVGQVPARERHRSGQLGGDDEEHVVLLALLGDAGDVFQEEVAFALGSARAGPPP